MTSPSQYLESHHVTFYMEDCITQLLLYKEDNPKVNARNFMADYFKCLNSGNHVLLREFAFVSATPHNRLSFVRLIYRAYCNLNEVGDCLCLQELHSLLLLLCPDLPWRLVEAAGHTAQETVLAGGGSEGTAAQTPASSSHPDSLKHVRFLFSDFLMAFQIHLLYDEFLEKCAQLYESLLSGRSNNIDVFLPQTDQQQQQQTEETANSGATSAAAVELQQRVSSSAFSRLIEGVCHELQLHVPNMDIIKKSLGSNRTTTYREFVGGLVRNKELSAALVTETELTKTVESPLFSAKWPTALPPVAPGSAAQPVTSLLVSAPASASALAVAPPHSAPTASPAASVPVSATATAGQQRQKRLIAGAPKPKQQQQQQKPTGRPAQRTAGSSSGSSDVSVSSGAVSTDSDSDSV
ncbi:hypothetical protein BOX15_Mlig000482g2 [Macrostomum lignano]|uniref:Centriolar satellite-associated tubulin polyglutamylase complex regulator 1 n=1 Tax=Macrostomum lignano TaxID=282301 RepID=A0A267EF80_9PLAT|nr:hypothetical protein BOX15_Mlig000482g2 [Macrostomum lignano]